MLTPCGTGAHKLWSVALSVGSARFLYWYDDEDSATYAEQVGVCPGGVADGHAAGRAATSSSDS
jgi:hypothetical protein